MKETNTMAFHIVDINAGTHCNHFVGFKIFAGKEKNSTNIWGIVNIDILDVANKDFYAILGQSNDEKVSDKDERKLFSHFSSLL